MQIAIRFPVQKLNHFTKPIGSMFAVNTWGGEEGEKWVAKKNGS